MSDVCAFRIVGEGSSARNSLLATLGFLKEAEGLLSGGVKDTAHLARQALRAYVPVYGGELRNSIQINGDGPFSSRVIVPDTSRQNHPEGGKDTRRQTKKFGVRVSNALLAEILEQGVKRASPELSIPSLADTFSRSRAKVSGGQVLTRSQDALRDGPFQGPKRKQPTASWIELAQNALDEELGRG